MMDPIGLALDNFDVTGTWRIRENGAPRRHARAALRRHAARRAGRLRSVLLKRTDVVLRTFTENLMAYASAAASSTFDMPTVRKIVRDAAAHAESFLVVRARAS